MIKKFFTWLIRLYQKFISPYKGFMCPYTPSCSRYGLDSIEKHGVIKGGILTLWRLLRCNPFSHGGYDPVPDEFKLINVRKRKEKDVK